MYQSSRKQSGFTLIELMVVMSIIAILATAGLAAYTNYLKGARDSVRATAAREIVTKVEAYSSIYGPPQPSQMVTFLTTEGVTVKDPLGGKPVCVDDTGLARMVCKINYHQFTDGTYAISYGVEKTNNLINPHYSNKLNGVVVADTAEIYGSFIGNNKTLSVTPSPSTVHLEAKPDLVASSISVDANTLSSSGSYINGTSGGGGGTPPGSIAIGGACTANVDCASTFCGINICTTGVYGSPCNNANQCAQPSSCGGANGPNLCYYSSGRV